MVDSCGALQPLRISHVLSLFGTLRQPNFFSEQECAVSHETHQRSSMGTSEFGRCICWIVRSPPYSPSCAFDEFLYHWHLRSTPSIIAWLVNAGSIINTLLSVTKGLLGRFHAVHASSKLRATRRATGNSVFVFSTSMIPTYFLMNAVSPPQTLATYVAHGIGELASRVCFRDLHNYDTGAFFPSRVKSGIRYTNQIPFLVSFRFHTCPCCCP